MQKHNLKRNIANKKSARVGRGGKRGKTSGRGHKGQKARSGHKLRPEIRDTIKRIHKRRGYGINRARTVNSGVIKPATVNVSTLQTICEAGTVVTPTFLLEKHVVRRQKGRVPAVKILAKGDLALKLTIEGCLVSEGAKTKIEAAGGAVK
ncbi:MAG: 50S ribosomal protein L15 [Candidatus Yonathbacteria bacterium]|nr:50S ribosomal protein L15 [Candidatus Yonathbacteria bacterium]